MPKSENITWHNATISREERAEVLSSRGLVVWLTGLSGSGKSTVARALEKQLLQSGYFAYVLDGDNTRFGLNSDLGFSPEDRSENIRRVSEVASLFQDACLICICAFISPYRQDRKKIRSKLQDSFFEVYVHCPVEECEKRDPKGLYKKARSGDITDFTGISAPYEEPLQPELVINTATQSLDECVTALVTNLEPLIRPVDSLSKP